MAVVFANPTRNRANDVDYVYHQDPNFFYLTGWREPHAVLLLFSTAQLDAQGQYNELIYLQERDPRAEQWNGYRLGLRRCQAMGFDRLNCVKILFIILLILDDFDQVFMFDFQNDERDLAGDEFDLYQLKKTFKQAINFPENFKRTRYQIQQAIRTVTPENLNQVKNYVQWQVQRDSTLLRRCRDSRFCRIRNPRSASRFKMKSAFVLKEFNFDVSKLQSY